MKKFSAPFFIFILLLSITAVTLLRAQLPQGFSGKKISYAFQDQKTLKLKAIFTGQNAKQVTGSQVLVSEFAMKTFRNGDTNQVELIIEAPECLVDRSNSVASSPGKLQAYTATTNFQIQGEGFFCQQSNALLIISNKVETTIRKELLKSRSPAKTSQPIAPDFSDSTNQILKIFSDYFEFLYESNLVTYTGNVRVDDAHMNLTCDVLTIYLTTNKTVRRITAENRVVIVNKKDDSRATGDRAIYVVNTNEEFVELTGNPAWTDGKQEGKADLFVFDRRSNIFHAETNAVFKLPRDKIGQTGLPGSNTTLSTNTTGKLVEIFADHVTVKFPETNGPVQEIIAEQNVVILSEGDQSRATGAKAVYSEATGIVELTGNPVWKNNQSEIKADVLAIAKTNQMFSAKGNVAMKLPAHLFKATTSAETNSPAVTNKFVEIFCDDFLYETNVAQFNKNVRAESLDEHGSQTTLQCDFGKVLFGPGNQVETVFANKNVVMQQIPATTLQTNLLKKTLSCESLTLNRSLKTGLIGNIRAETQVIGEQTERAVLGETVKRISAEIVDINFSPVTNQIETVVAQSNVLAEKILLVGGTNKTTQASGEKAVYRAAAEMAELTGHPSARTEAMLLSNPSVILLNMKTGTISWGGLYSVTPLNSTNNLKSLRRTAHP